MIKDSSTMVSRLTIGRAVFSPPHTSTWILRGQWKQSLTAPCEGVTRDSPYSWIRWSEILHPSSLTPSTKSRSVCTKGHRRSRKTRNETKRADRRSGIFKAPHADTNQFLGNRVRTEEHKMEVERKSKLTSRVCSHRGREQTKKMLLGTSRHRLPLEGDTGGRAV